MKWAALLLCAVVFAPKNFAAEPIRALMIAGGCCHDYPNQCEILSTGISQRANVEWDIARQEGTARDVQMALYDDPNWADGYDVVLHNECFGGVDDAPWLERIVETHTKNGVPAMFVHCSLHSYRASPTDEWRKLMGATSTSHEGHRPVEVENLKPNHPVMTGFPAKWKTPNGELYKITKLWPDAIPLGRAYGVDTDQYHTCIWLNHYGNSRVFTTTLGHHNDTMMAATYLDMISRGLLWTVGKLEVNGEPSEGYGPRNTASNDKRSVLAGDYQKKVIAHIDGAGKTLWSHPIRSIHDAHRLDNGNFLFQSSWTDILEVNPDGDVVWSYDASSANGNAGKKVEVHAFQRLDKGVTMIAESGPARIIEVDRDGNLLKSVPLKVDNPHPHHDTRLARKLDNGNYLVCHEKDMAVREYDSDGVVVWEYNTGTEVYGATRLNNGNTLIGTGSGSSVLEVNSVGDTVWSLTSDDLEGIELAWVTTVEETENGTYLIGNCHAGPDNPQILEVNKDKDVLWTFKDFDTFGNAMPCSVVWVD